MKKYEVKINNMKLEIIQDDDGKFITPNICREDWGKFGTALKPSFEPIIVARKPFRGSLVDNVIKYGVGGLNIDGCRVGDERRTYRGCSGTSTTMKGGAFENGSKKDTYYTAEGRFPANTILTYDQITFDEVCGGFPNTKSTPRTQTIGGTGGVGQVTSFQRDSETSPYNDSGSASRYFYCAKASKKDRDEGLDKFEEKGAKKLLNREENSDGASWNGKYSSGNAFAGSGAPKKNTHPTVKPTALMQYLIRLVSPKGSTILDPFMGSGSTGKAAMYENKERQANYTFLGIEKEKEYCDIARARIEYVINKEEQ